MELEELYGKFYKEILAYCAAMTKSAAYSVTGQKSRNSNDLSLALKYFFFQL